MGGGRAQAEAVCRALLARDHDSSVTAGARNYLARTLVARGRARDALRELEAAAGSAAPGSAELATARTLESFARLSVGDLMKSLAPDGRTVFVKPPTAVAAQGHAEWGILCLRVVR